MASGHNARSGALRATRVEAATVWRRTGGVTRVASRAHRAVTQYRRGSPWSAVTGRPAAAVRDRTHVPASGVLTRQMSGVRLPPRPPCDQHSCLNARLLRSRRPTGCSVRPCVDPPFGAASITNVGSEVTAGSHSHLVRGCEALVVEGAHRLGVRCISRAGLARSSGLHWARPARHSRAPTDAVAGLVAGGDDRERDGAAIVGRGGSPDHRLAVRGGAGS
jgi:hypothetical protein